MELCFRARGIALIGLINERPREHHMAQNQPVFSWSSILLGACLVGTLICDAPAQAQGTGGSSANHPGVAGSATATYPGAPFRNTVGQPSTFQNSVGQTMRFGGAANRSAASPSNPGNFEQWRAAMPPMRRGREKSAPLRTVCRSAPPAQDRARQSSRSIRGAGERLSGALPRS